MRFPTPPFSNENARKRTKRALVYKNRVAHESLRENITRVFYKSITGFVMHPRKPPAISSHARSREVRSIHNPRFYRARDSLSDVPLNDLGSRAYKGDDFDSRARARNFIIYSAGSGPWARSPLLSVSTRSRRLHARTFCPPGTALVSSSSSFLTSLSDDNIRTSRSRYRLSLY